MDWSADNASCGIISDKKSSLSLGDKHKHVGVERFYENDDYDMEGDGKKLKRF